jgi:hypothetical protein
MAYQRACAHKTSAVALILPVYADLSMKLTQAYLRTLRASMQH